jgi:NAD(P)-dependent dehydrogenase (short-subunit alcohol dehydrogenase family)
MTQKLEGKVAVITGGGNGVGRATVLAMAAEGAKVVINDISSETDGSKCADKVAAEVKKAGGTAAANYDSVATMAGGENIIKTATSNFGRIDILVNCAGNFAMGPTAEFSEKDWDSLIAVHLKGLFSVARAAIREMIKQKSGRIIAISSRGAFVYTGPAISYVTAKAGVLGFMVCLAAEMKEHGITVNAVLPNAKTNLFSFPVGKALTGGGMAPRSEPDFVAPVILYLATDEAKDITGKIIYCGGGDICLYAQPLQLPGAAHMLIHKDGKWTLEELSRVIPH